LPAPEPATPPDVDLDSDSSVDNLFSPPADGRLPGHAGFVPDFTDLELSDDKNDRISTELRGFEERFTGCVATIGTNELFTKFLNEVRVLQQSVQGGSGEIPENCGRLRALMTEIESSLPINRSLLQIEALVKEVNFALATCRKALADAQLPDGQSIEEELAEVTQQWKTIQAERSRAAVERLSATLADEMRQLEDVSEKNSRERAQVLAELRDLRGRIVARRRAPGGRGAKDGELDGLIARHGDLIERLAKLP
jgi:hypothetical protein